MYRHPSNGINAKAELRSNQGQKGSAEQLAPLGHGIYPIDKTIT